MDVFKKLQAIIILIISFFLFIINSGSTNKNQQNDWALSDVSGMFNERGYYNSNSVSVDENEIISDFNGNLNYSIPMFNMKGPGDISLNLSLNYNGSVNYEVIAADTNFAVLNNLPRYNISAPGWILSLNGMAVQMLNFETNFFTKPVNNSDTVIQNDKVRLLATGYQITDKLQGVTENAQDIFMIMRGDGTVMNLRRITNDDCQYSANFENCYIGEYYSDNKGDYTRAKVEFIETGSFPSYRNRRVSVMKGDGLTYIYEEYKNSYMDFPYNVGSQNFRPQVLMLKRVEDRFGNFLDLSYLTTINVPLSGNQYIYGRPLLGDISASWKSGNVSFNYYPVINNAIIVRNYLGTYKILLDAFNVQVDGVHRSNVTQIKNPANEDINIEYQTYNRRAYQVKNARGNTDYVSLRPTPKRISSFQNYNGGTRKYLYAGTDTSINMHPNSQFKIMSGIIGTNYFGQGRDIFFSNMLVSKRTYEGTTLIKTDSIIYNYITTRTENEWKAIPVDDSDDYYTRRIVFANHSALNNSTPETIYYNRHYKNYRLKSVEDNPENPDWPGYTKLLYEKQWVSNENNPDKEITYQFNANKITVFMGSFLDTTIIENIKGIERKNRFEYTHSSSPFTGNEASNNPIVNKKEKDPFGRVTESVYRIIYDTSIHYRNAWFNADFPNDPNHQDFDTTYFYMLNLTDTNRIFNSQGNLLYKETYEYSPTNNNEAYIAQLKSKKVFNSDGFSDYKQIQYKYFIKDTIGVIYYLTSNTKPSNEGKLKEVIDARGNSVKYFYHPIFDETNLDNILAPLIKYYRVLTDGTSGLYKERWEDTRFPAITYYNPSGNFSFNSFQQYSPSGNRTMFLNSYRFLSEFTYEPLERINNITLPYDFDTLGSQEIKIFDTTFINVDYILKSNAEGYINYLAPPNQQVNKVMGCNGSQFTSKVFINGAFTDNRNALIGFSDTIINHLYRLDYAHLIFYPTLYSHSYAGYDSAKYAVVKFIPLTYFGSTSISEGVSSYNTHNIYSTSSENCSNGFAGFSNLIDLTGLLNYNIIQLDNNFAGLRVNIDYNDPAVPDPPPNYEFHLNIGNCIDQCYNCGCSLWLANYSPRLHISGVYAQIDTTIYKIYNNSTIKYEYDDINHKTSVISKLNSNEDKKTGFLFDEYYRIKQSRLYTNQNDFDSSSVRYNYLGQKSITKDGNSNQTKYSYDELLNPSITENADNSQTIDSSFYLNGYNYTFGSIPGLVIRKVFTDETGRKFEKYFDAVGNLRHEVKFAENNQNPSVTDTLRTDYLYDALYRVIQVKTPNNKYIYYSYDGYGRQSERTTPDAGTVKFKYDKNDNLRFAQDENQRNKPSEYRESRFISFRGYDKLNRLLYSGDTYTEGGTPEWNDLNPDNTDDFEDYGTYPNNFLTINLYDTITTAFENIFTPPQEYYSEPFFTIGNLFATAYKTIGTEKWNYKYYRYDARGRVIKMWNIIDGFTSTIDYEYNSANQVIRMVHNDDNSNNKDFRYTYDLAGRMKSTGYFDKNTVNEFAGYSYNRNSQIDTHRLGNGILTNKYLYNNRNRITDYTGNKINYSLIYLQNGNIATQVVSGDYKLNFANTGNIRMYYTYDKSNRLLSTESDTKPANYQFTGNNTYDYDGNLLTLSRSTNGDNFSYTYYTGTNRLRSVNTNPNLYQYDYNGNVISDGTKNIYDIVYDYRNLIVEFKRNVTIQEERITYRYQYRYDESGNRIEKITDMQKEETWVNIDKEYYIRDVSGKEIAVHTKLENADWLLSFYNVWGLSNEGQMLPDGTKYYYLKDHLGSVRAIYDQKLNLISAVDLDAWGYTLTNRTYNDTNKYKFTSKERDKESTYDYFGARYYDARIAKWGQMEPIYDKYLSFSSYQYGLLNPLSLKDMDGKDVIVIIEGKTITFQVNIYFKSIDKYGDSRYNLSSSQVEYYQEKIKDAQDMWNEINKINYQDKEYDIKFEFNFKEVTTNEEKGRFNEIYFQAEEGYNIALPSEFESGNPKVDNGNRLYFPNIEGKSGYPQYWNAHELGHLMGLKHNVPKSIRGADNDIMGYSEHQFKPRKENVTKLLKLADLTNSSQIIKGATEDY
jgi:RHS repeat-associated protein